MEADSKPPNGLEWPTTRNAKENPVLAFLHDCIDKLLKATGENDSTAEREEGDGAAATSGWGRG